MPTKRVVTRTVTTHTEVRKVGAGQSGAGSGAPVVTTTVTQHPTSNGKVTRVVTTRTVKTQQPRRVAQRSVVSTSGGTATQHGAAQSGNVAVASAHAAVSSAIQRHHQRAGYTASPPTTTKPNRSPATARSRRTVRQPQARPAAAAAASTASRGTKARRSPRPTQPAKTASRGRVVQPSEVEQSPRPMQRSLGRVATFKYAHNEPIVGVLSSARASPRRRRTVKPAGNNPRTPVGQPSAAHPGGSTSPPRGAGANAHATPAVHAPIAVAGLDGTGELCICQLCACGYVRYCDVWLAFVPHAWHCLGPANTGVRITRTGPPRKHTTTAR